MAEESADEKTEAPSEKRRADSREKGNVPKSTEINSVLVLLSGILLLKMFGPWMIKQMSQFMEFSIMLISHPQMSQTSLVELFVSALVLFCKIIAPVVVGIMVFGIVSNVVQIGFLFTWEPLIPKFEKINPISGFGRLFAARSFVELLKNVVKLVIIGTIAYVTIKNDFDTLLLLADASVGTIWIVTVDLCFKVILRISIAMIVIAVLDFAYQRYESEKKLRMTKQEVKEERKQMDGDPLIKSRIRSLQREMARRRMMDEVPKATVVVTNPTHLAIAIQYDAEEMDTPKVIAKGKRLIAQRIKQIAYDNDIPTIEDKPLARAMYDKVEVGSDLPMEFFAAVAEILAYVYRLKNKAAA